MKKFFRIAAAVCIAAMTAGCGTTLLNTGNNTTMLTNVELSRANFKVIKNVEGFSSTVYIFGIGGLSRKQVRESAVADMMRNAKLTESQAVVNVHVKNHFINVLCIYMRSSCTATAQVIEFLPETDAHATDMPAEIAATTATTTASATVPAYTKSVTGSQKRYDIGDMYDNGTTKGYVFEISEGGLHGKIVYPKIVDRAQWCAHKQEYLPAAVDEYDGEANMRVIRREADWQERYPAFATCAHLGEQWYLPARHELELLCDLLYNNRIIDLKVSDAWTSTINSTSRKTVKTYSWNNSRAKEKNYIIAVAKF